MTLKPLKKVANRKLNCVHSFAITAFKLFEDKRIRVIIQADFLYSNLDVELLLGDRPCEPSKPLYSANTLQGMATICIEQRNNELC